MYLRSFMHSSELETEEAGMKKGIGLKVGNL
jgi:hypothetical protein